MSKYKEFNYNGGVFIFVDRLDGYNFIHKLSGNGFYGAIFYERFGRPSVNNYKEVFKKFAENCSHNTRADIESCIENFDNNLSVLFIANNRLAS